MYKEYSGGLAAELLSHQMDFVNWAFNTHPDEVLGTGGIDFYRTAGSLRQCAGDVALFKREHDRKLWRNLW